MPEREVVRDQQKKPALQAKTRLNNGHRSQQRHHIIYDPFGFIDIFDF
jgi:hypothetical protein